jgi:hypothetical protein
MANEASAAQAQGEAARIAAETETRAALESVNDDAARAIAAAQEETDRANAAANEIARAAMATDLGQRIAQSDERNATWQGQMQTEVASTKTMLGEMTSLLQRLVSPPAQPSSLTPAPSAETPLPVTVVQPVSVPSGEGHAAQPTPAQPDAPRPKKIRL